MIDLVRWVEVHRLAVAGRQARIARKVGGQLGQVWLGKSRYTDVAALAKLTLSVGEDAFAFYQLGWANKATGNQAGALAAYSEALRLFRAAGQRSGEAATLSNIGNVYTIWRQHDLALQHSYQALVILREIGDRAGEATTLNNIGLAFNGLGRFQEAVDYYLQVLPVLREIGDIALEGTVLNNIGEVHYRLGQTEQALQYYDRALPIRRQVGDRAGEALTLHNIGSVLDRFQRFRDALTYYQQALVIRREVADRVGESVTRYNIAMLHRRDGDLNLAIIELEQVVELDRQTNHPDLAADTMLLEQLQQERNQVTSRPTSNSAGDEG